MLDKKLLSENPPQNFPERSLTLQASLPAKPSADDLVGLTNNLINLWDHGGLMRPKDKELTPEFLQILVWAVEDLTPAQHQQGIRHLVRYQKHFPNGAELRAACLGIPVGAEIAQDNSA
jgi:hypothetical protein